MTLAEQNKGNFDNIEKVANVEVKLMAELGKTKMLLKDVIEYDSGSVIMLDRTDNEPVDVYVNDVLIARGKIVAVEDSYGIKIVEIIDNNQENKKHD